MFPRGRGNAGHCAVTLYVGEGLRGSNGACSPLHQISVTPSATHNQIGPLWCWFPSGWACAHSRPLWVSPTTSPVRLGVSPAAPTPMGIFNQRTEALFPSAGALGYVVCFAPCSFVPVYLCESVGPWGLPVVSLPAQFVPHSTSLYLARATRVLSAPVPVSAPPTGLEVCFFFIYLVLDFLAVRFSVSSDCGRRRRVSTYAAILVPIKSRFFISRIIYLTGFLIASHRS